MYVVGVKVLLTARIRPLKTASYHSYTVSGTNRLCGKLQTLTIALTVFLDHDSCEDALITTRTLQLVRPVCGAAGAGVQPRQQPEVSGTWPQRPGGALPPALRRCEAGDEAGGVRCLP